MILLSKIAYQYKTMTEETRSHSTNPNPLESFVDYLMTESGYTGLAPEYQASYREQLSAQVYRRIGLIAMNELPESKAAEFANLLGDDPAKVNQTEVEQFLTASIPDFSTKLQVGLDQFAKEFLSAGK